jgi:hypothetical protein
MDQGDWDDEEEQGMPDDEQQPEPPTLSPGIKVIAYKGRSVTIRRITVEDMKKQGFDIPEDLEWSRQNGKVIDASGLSDSAIEFLIKDPQLELREG